MKIMDMPLAALRFQYSVVRWPLTLVDQQMTARLDPEAPAVLFYERSLGMLDNVIGTALRAPDLSQRGATLIERSDGLRRAAQLDSEARAKSQRAVADLQDAERAAERERSDAREQKSDSLVQARSDAQQRKRAAADDAQKRLHEGNRQVESVAAQRKSAIRATKQKVKQTVRAAAQEVAGAADQVQEDARAKLNEAAAKRLAADQTEQLVEAEKLRHT
jgi:hypothetical protein